MLLDYEQELTAAGGQLMNASDGNAEYGSKPYDLKAAGVNPATVEPLALVVQVDDANSDVGTSYDLQLVTDTDGAGAGEVVVGTKTVLVAALLLHSLHYVPIDPSLITKQYLTFKCTTHGGTPTTGKLKAWLQKGINSIPVNEVQPG